MPTPIMTPLQVDLLKHLSQQLDRLLEDWADTCQRVGMDWTDIAANASAALMAATVVAYYAAAKKPTAKEFAQYAAYAFTQEVKDLEKSKKSEQF